MTEDQERVRFDSVLFGHDMLSAVDETVLLLLEAAGGTMRRVVLNKALFYLELSALRDFGRPITQAEFVALDQGPVLHNYRHRLDELQRDGWVRNEERGDSKPVVLERHLEEPRCLSAEQQSKIREFGLKYASLRGSLLSRISHENPGWQIAYDEGLGAGNHAQAINMLIALQQVVDKDEWLAQPATAIETEWLERPAEGDVIPW